MPPSVDIDGTLVDTTYFHAISWARALRAFDRTPPVWELHRLVGMGSDQLVARICGDEFEAEHGDGVRDQQGERYGELIGEVVALPGARALLEALVERGHAVVLASSAKPEELDHYLDLLDGRDLAKAWIAKDDVEGTKPSPDPIELALERSGADTGVMVGDSVWDVEAARNAGLESIAVMTGGFGGDELREAGAAGVFRSLDDLREQLENTPFGDRAEAVST